MDHMNLPVFQSFSSFQIHHHLSDQINGNVNTIKSDLPERKESKPVFSSSFDLTLLSLLMGLCFLGPFLFPLKQLQSFGIFMILIIELDFSR